jgi:hypothetical protein
MSLPLEAFRVDIGGFVMQLRRSELRAVLAGLPGNVDAGDEPSLVRLAAAVWSLGARDRAPLWELAVRHYARGRPLDQAAGEIGMDAVHGRALLDALSEGLAT